jgi:hypothetical protein
LDFRAYRGRIADQGKPDAGIDERRGGDSGSH